MIDPDYDIDLVPESYRSAYWHHLNSEETPTERVLPALEWLPWYKATFEDSKPSNIQP